MPIISSQIVSATVQASGDRSVHERHTDHAGRSYDVSYFAPASMDIAAVLSARAERIGADVDAREAVAAEAANYTLPLTKLEFRQRFTPAERAAIDDFNDNYATSELLTAAQKSAMRVTLEDYRVAQNILLTDSGTIRGVQMYEALGLISPGRAAEVLA